MPVEQNKNNNPNQKPEGQKPKNFWTPLLISLVLVLIFSWVFNAVSRSQYNETRWDEFVQTKEAGELKEVEIHQDARQILYMTKEEAAKDPRDQKVCLTALPNGNFMELSNELEAMGVDVNVINMEDNSMITMILSYVVMIGGMFLLMNLLTKRMGGDGMMGSFGKSKAKVYMEKQTGVTFKDVAGQDEAKESLQETCSNVSRR